MNACFVTMMYGLAMPILFPLASIQFVSIYVCERVLLVYIYKLPPQMDNRLFNYVIRIMYFAPLLFISNCFWMIDNKQIFDG